MSTFLDYIAEISGGDSQTAIARHAGVTQSNVSRWKQGSTPSPEAVIRLAQHYQRPVAEALYRSGLIGDETAERLRIDTGLSGYTHTALLREVERRLDQMSQMDDSITPPPQEEDPNPDDYRLAAGRVARPDDRHAD